MAVRLQGFAEPHRLASALAAPVEHATARLRALIDAGLVEERTGHVSGFVLTDDGRKALDDALDSEGLFGDATLMELYERFESLDGGLKRIANDWQIRRHGPAEVLNDHADPDYDQSVIDRLRELHDRACALLTRVADRAPRLSTYRPRLDACLRSIEDGTSSAFVGTGECYHQIWFELHEDLLQTLGLERRE